MAGLAFSEMQQETPQTCIVDIVPPTGGVIQTLVNNPDGSLKATWNAIADANPPTRVRLFAKFGDNVNLFDPANLIYEGPGLTFDIYKIGGNPITQGQLCFVGTRGVDQSGNENSNTQNLSVSATGLGYQNLLNLIGVLNTGVSTVEGQIVEEPISGEAIDEVIEGIIEPEEPI